MKLKSASRKKSETKKVTFSGNLSIHKKTRFILSELHNYFGYPVA